MLKSSIYINGIGAVSPQGVGSGDLFSNSTNPPKYEHEFISCIEPNYADFIAPNNIRRMSKLMKTSVVAAKLALKDSGLEKPDAIITGTGMGCMEDTEKFLKGIVNDEGSPASPTAFIHSTHNTISSQVAIALNCTGYNSTYVHRASSFETALTDAIIQLKDEGSDAHNILVGGVDEITSTIYDITKQLYFWKKSNNEKSPLYNSTTKGAIAGEGMIYFSLSNKLIKNTYAEITAIKIFQKAFSASITSNLLDFIKANELEVTDIDLVVLGNNGDVRYDHYYKEVSKLFEDKITFFKELCGEYFTSASFGLGLAATTLKNNRGKFKKALLYNQFQGINHCFYLLSNVEV